MTLFICFRTWGKKGYGSNLKIRESMDKEKVLFTDKEIVVSETSKIFMFDYQEIACFITDRPYVIIRTRGKKCVQIKISILLIAKLAPTCFCMCSQSAIVNLSHVVSYEECQQRSWVLLESGDVVYVSRRYRKNLRDQIMLFKKKANVVAVIADSG